jgi:hypothetical protein
MPRKKLPGAIVTTVEQKLAAAKRLVAKYEAQISSKNIVANVLVGDHVTFKFGRTKGVRMLTGEIAGFRESTVGAWVAILTGKGIDSRVVRIRVQDITHNPTADARDRGVGIPVS